MSVCSLCSGCFGPRFDRKIDQNLLEYGVVDSPEAHPCRSSGDLEIANKQVSYTVAPRTDEPLALARDLVVLLFFLFFVLVLASSVFVLGSSLDCILCGSAVLYQWLSSQ